MHYPDGGKYCNRCGYYEAPGKGSSEAVSELQAPLPSPKDKSGLSRLVEVNTYPFRKEYRGIPAFVAELFEVRMECDSATGEVAASYYPVKRKGEIVGYKVRKHPKIFSSFPKGATKGEVDLFGCGTASKAVVITGGEEDAMAAYYMLLSAQKDDRFEPCVYSVVHGEQAVQDISNNIQFLNKFDRVVLCMDNDGKTKEKEIASLLGPKAHIMSFSEKDANDMLREGKQREFITAYFKAAPYKPQELIWATELVEAVFEEEQQSPVRYPFKQLDNMLGGMRKKELVTICAGTGVGKTTLLHHIILHVLEHWKVGTMCLEESPRKTLQNVCKVGGLHSPEELKALVDGRVLMLDCFGSNTIEAIEETVRYMAAVGMDLLVLDHVSMMVADIQDDERRTLDKIMVKLRTLVQELNVAMIVICHLRRAQGDSGYEDGKQVSLSALRSSASVAQLSDAVIALERKVSDDDSQVKNQVNLRILKNRYLGLTGKAGKLRYTGSSLKEIL